MATPWRPLAGLVPRFVAPMIAQMQSTTQNLVTAWSMGAVREMKTRSSIKRMCEDCRIVKRRGVLFVYCDRNPKHKQRQG